ncbi:hypothetical protein GA0115254_126512 [Streptomyces sp. Ncost-T10-10d]|nr:hypothetical protein GA0115254_126512 [Streptomyces sp. Ncost-T10-10d]
MGFESWLERDHAMLLDFTPQVMGLLSQPLWLFWEDELGRTGAPCPTDALSPRPRLAETAVAADIERRERDYPGYGHRP